MVSRTSTAAALAARDHNGAPLYMQVVSVVRDWISQGRLEPGARLDSEKTLGELFGVSRITVRKALELLTREGLVESVQGKGTFVTSRPSREPVQADMSQRIERARALARSSSIGELEIETLPAAPQIAHELLLEDGEPVLRIAYIRLLADQPIGYAESFWPASLDIEVTPEDLRENTLLTLLEAKQVELSGIDHLVGATLADARLARLLKVAVGAPLVRVRLSALDTRGRPLQKVESYFRADQYEHHIFLAR